MIKAFRAVALAEATSFLALLVASYVKNTGGAEAGVTVLGPIHGALFVAYVLLALRVRDRLSWSTRTTAWVIAGAVLPFGGFVVDRWMARRRPSAA
jgi:integral membrane protein